MLVKPTAQLLCLLVAVTSLAGCGFQLRSYNLTASLESYALTGLTRAQVAAPLRRTLTQIGVNEVEAEAADLVIELLDQRNDRRSISTAGNARAEEYELDYAVEYQLLDSSGQVIAAPTWVQRQRVYRIDRGNIVGSSEEQAILTRELMQDVAGQIVRAIDLVTRPQTP